MAVLSLKGSKALDWITKTLWCTGKITAQSNVLNCLQFPVIILQPGD